MTKATLSFLRSSHRVALALLAIVVVSSVVGCGPQSTATPQATVTPLPTAKPTATPRPTPTPLPTPTPQPIDVVVLHTNDVIGYTEPCGWRPPKGGLARRASVIKETRDQFENVLLLDAGNAMWSQRPLAQQTEGKVIVDAMNLMEYDAMAVGDIDLLLGPDVLRQRIADAQFPILSANVLVAGEQQLLAEPYTIVTLGDHKVGIIGLTWDEAVLPSEQFQLLKAEDVLAQYVPQLAEQVDTIIVLSTMGFEEDQELSRLAPGIDLIVGGRNRLPLPESWQNQETGAIVTQAGAQGEWIGRRLLHLNSAGEVIGHADELLLLTEDYPDDPEMRAFLDSYSVQ